MTAKLITMFTIGISTAILEKLLESNGKSTSARYVDMAGTGSIITIALGVLHDVVNGLRSM